MNAVIDAIKRRRSVRSYRPDLVPRDVLEVVIDAGNWAPTGNNVQRWRFVVVQPGEFRDRLLRAALPTFRRLVDASMKVKDAFTRAYFVDFAPRCLGLPPLQYEESVVRLRDLKDGVYWGAPAIIFVIGTAHDECAMVCQNLMLAATSLGLGSCIVGFGAQVTDDAEVVAALELKDDERIFGPVVVGYPKIDPTPPPKKPPLIKWL